ncbi:MAG: hypothetical protein ACRYG7_51365 [Janthinobacterium lividum]
MKTSTTYLLAALLVLLASLTAYNMALRTEYHSGAYKDPLRNYEVLGFKDFTEIAIPAASGLNVKVLAGPFSVRVNPTAAKLVRISQQGGRLRITLAFPGEPESLGWGETVVVSCPRLTALTTDGTYEVAGQPRHSPTFVGRSILVQGFTQDSLSLRQDRGSRVELKNNRLGLLRAVVGTTPGSHPILQLNSGNHIAAANLTLAHQSELVLDNVPIAQLHHRFGDSVKVTLAGAALGSLKR